MDEKTSFVTMTRCSHNQKLYDRLLDVVGTMEDIRKRQDMFKCMDIVNGFGDIDSISISTGSLTEGLNLKGSDEDMMLVLKFINVVPEHVTLPREHNDIQVRMRLVENRGGYAKLYLTEDEKLFVRDRSNAGRNEILYMKRSLENNGGICVVASARFRGQFILPGITSHGPCVTNGVLDYAHCLSGSTWPQSAIDRVVNCKSKRWLTEELTEQILSEKCIYAPVGPKHYYFGSLWRISFALSEKKLIFSMNHVQMLCYGLLKLVLKEGIADRLPGDSEVLCSYHLKTCMFWMIEETDNDVELWCKDNLYMCFLKCLDKLSEWVEACYCPNYVVPENNLFVGKVNENNKADILNILSDFKNGGIEILEKCESLGPFLTSSKMLTDVEREADLDVLVYRVLHIYPFDERDVLLSVIEDLEKQHTSPELHPFMKEVLGLLLSSLYRGLAQMVDPSAEENEEMRAKALELQKDYLRKGIGLGLLDGLLLMASFHHKNGDHRAALDILCEVIERLKPDKCLLLRRNPEFTDEEKTQYMNTYCGHGLSLETKLQAATVATAVLYDNSTVLPDEFQPEVRNYRPLLMVPPTIFAHALMFLCYHHLGEQEKAEEKLRQMEKTIESKHLIMKYYMSHACVVTGVCYETMGDYQIARMYYKLAMSHKPTCRSTKYRIEHIEKLLSKKETNV